jgi:hypothetical protein
MPTWKDAPDEIGFWYFRPKNSGPRWVDLNDEWGLDFMTRVTRERGRFCGPFASKDVKKLPLDPQQEQP